MSEAFYWAERADVTTSTAKENVAKLSSNHRNWRIILPVTLTELVQSRLRKSLIQPVVRKEECHHSAI